MMPIKKKQKAVKMKSGFFDAARIAAELGDKKKASVLKKAPATKKKPVTTVTTTVSVTKKSVSESAASNVGGHHRSLLGVAKAANSKEELVGFDDLNEEALKEERAVSEEEKRFSSEGLYKLKLKEPDSKSSGVIEIIGGAAMILILIEVIVIALILISMFFL